MTKPLFSVITITLDNLEGLKRTHESLQGQSTGNYEWIVIDGGSQDGSKEYLPHTNSLWISEPDHGIYEAMNKGIERTRGSYLIFMNAGDQFAAPDTLEKIQPAIAETKPDFIYGDALEENFYKYSRPHKKTWQGMFTHHQAMLYRRTALGDLRYDLRYKIAADYDFTIRFLQRAENILYCPFPICLFENGGISQLEALRGRREQFYIRKEAGQNLPGNIFIFAAQTLNLFLRRKCPRLYRFLKMRQRQAGNT